MHQNTPVYLGRYRDIIDRKGEEAVKSKETLMAATGSDEIFYVPFEWTNPAAKLVVVGITPGPNQMELAYRTASSKIKVGLDDEGILKAAKIHGAFGSPTMRPNLVKMMNHFGFADLFGIDTVDDFWGKNADIFLGTSVVPHAAFRRGKPFAGSFEDIMKSLVFSKCFHSDFITSLKDIPDTARFVALGETPLSALAWCVRQGHLKDEQVLGAFAHPSTSGGSAVDAYLGIKTTFDPRDPVKGRVDRLRMFYDRMRQSVEVLKSHHSADAQSG
ncbi:hypothetical protein ABIE78_001657 [Sinorhizobium fredii]|uniref:Uncharacterized protein n=1 Tax=Sinorhizobium fredii (strain USDA 257) TaxID=1185652 RepID=I3X9A5_SINF2|nr:hypothetical protein [Sinorhizobium fredii]AFL52461.1 hypothetical protein USDA257_c39170 [Sinorhizobium fredii USDA 257]